MPSSTSTTLGQRIQAFVNDAVTLDVLTLTGHIELDAAPVTPAQPAVAAAGNTPAQPAVPAAFNWDKLFANITEQMKPTAANKLEVVAYTHVEWDMDSVNFVRKDLVPADQALLDAHRKAVEAAQKSRLDAVKTIADIVGAAIP